MFLSLFFLQFSDFIRELFWVVLILHILVLFVLLSVNILGWAFLDV